MTGRLALMGFNEIEREEIERVSAAFRVAGIPTDAILWGMFLADQSSSIGLLASRQFAERVRLAVGIIYWYRPAIVLIVIIVLLVMGLR